MTSVRQRKSNRVNAQASTGPKTANGKARAAQNARRHGLSLSILADPFLSAKAENLAREIAGETASHDIFDCARLIAEAQIDVVRVRQARHELISRYLNDSDYRPNSHSRACEIIMKAVYDHLQRFGPEAVLPSELVQRADDVFYWKPQGAEKFSCIRSELSKQLAKMDRYERRALSRRKFAIRALDALRWQSPE